MGFFLEGFQATFRRDVVGFGMCKSMEVARRRGKKDRVSDDDRQLWLPLPVAGEG